MNGKPIKLHVGCGPRHLPGFMHVDIKKTLPHVDIACDLFDLPLHVEPGTVEEIYACHVVEHVSRHRIAELFDVFYDLLTPGGTLRLAVPDIGKAIELYASGKAKLYPTLYGQFWGGQKDEHDYHTIGFDFDLMHQFLSQAGFGDVQRYDWRDFLPPGFDDYSRSYLPHMDFDNGTLLSLNVTARKRKPLVVFCAGGMTNAINSVIASADLAARHDLKMFVHWVDGFIANDAKFTDLFALRDDAPPALRPTLIGESRFLSLLSRSRDALRLTHKPDMPQIRDLPGPPIINPGLLSDPDATGVSTTAADLVYFHVAELPMYVREDVSRHFGRFFDIVSFAPDVLAEAARQIASFPVPGPTIGLHLRGTDILSTKGISPGQVRQFAVDAAMSVRGRDPKRLPLFVATDDKEIRDLVAPYHDLFVLCDHPAYVTRRDPGASWYQEASSDHINCGELRHDGKTYKNFSSVNVYRPASQVKAGLVDLIILSNMEDVATFAPTGAQSTYFHFAHFLSLYNKSGKSA